MVLTILCLVAKFKRAIVDYTLVLLLTVRCITAFVLLRLLQDRATGFEQIDLKEQTHAIPSFAVPAYILACCNFKFNVLFTFPMTIVCIFLVDRQAMTPENDNLSCYVDPETQATKTSSIWFSYLAYQLIIAYMMRRVTLERFCEQVKSTKQQDQLKTLFDN